MCLFLRWRYINVCLQLPLVNMPYTKKTWNNCAFYCTRLTHMLFYMLCHKACPKITSI